MGVIMIKSRANFSIFLLLGIFFIERDILAVDKNFTTMMTPIITQAKALAFAHKNDPLIPMPIIAIAGSPAVGKSYFALILVELLQREGIRPTILRQDDFLEFSKVPGAIIHPYLNARKLRNFLDAMQQGEAELLKPFINRMRIPYCREERLVNYADTDIIIFEGVYSLCGPENFDFFKYCSFGIFMEADENDICTWHWERELTKPSKIRRSRGKFKRDLRENMKDYHAHILPCKENASFIVYKKEKRKYSVHTGN
jgi:pantothenate kinase